jgi:outer membrane receptor protein involved in Fe transport
MKYTLQGIRGVSRVFMFLIAGAAVAFGQASDKSIPVEKTKDTAAKDDSIVTLSPFTVQADKDYGYRKTSTVTTSRVAMQVVDNPQSVEILSGELLRDMDVKLPKEVFRYTSSVLVGESEIGQAGLYTMRSFQLPIFYNGLALASSFSLTPIIPVDNLDRVEIAKGPVALYFTNSTPNGVVNFVTKKPEFINSSSYKFTAGSFNFYKALVDTQYVISKEKGLAMRVIASYQDWNGRVDYQHSSLMFIDPSFTWRPNDKFEFTVEYNQTGQKSPYATFFWGGAINPQYWKDVMTPSAQIVAYMKSAYSLADDAAALAKINSRWGYPAPASKAIGPATSDNQGAVEGTYMLNWSNDILGMTGRAPYMYTGSTIDWWRFSPRGDKMAQAGPDSNFDGDAQMADATATFTPIKDLSIRYHWLHMVNNTAFTRQLYTPDAGLRPDGRVIAMNWAGALSWTPHRYGTSDAQQVDANYTFEAAGMKHAFNIGAEWDHTKATIDNVTTDFTKASPGVDSQGNTLTGYAAYAYYDPWGSTPQQGLYKVVSGGPIQTNLSLANFFAETFSYHGMAFNDRLSFVVGMRHSKLVNTGRTDNSPTYGAIFEVTKGIHLFASQSEMSTFTNQLSVIGPGVLPSDNAHLLDNEKDKGWELGIKTDFNNSEFSGTLSFYNDKREGFIQLDYQKSISDPRNIGPNITVTQAQPYVNGGIQEAAGMEFDLTWTPSRNFQLITNYAWQYTAKWVSDVTLNPATPGALQNQTFYRRLIKSPKNRANLIGKYNFTSGDLRNLSLGGAVRWTDWYWVTASPQYWLIVPKETIIDLFATYSTKIFDVPTDYQLNVMNVTNQINDITRSNGMEIRLSAGFKF